MDVRNVKIRRIVAFLLVAVIIIAGRPFDGVGVNADTTENMVTLYFVDNTNEQWVRNDNAVMVLVDNTNGHINFDMTKLDDTTWSAQVPESAYNITFNRYDEGKTTQWNSWSAGGRDNNNAYYADGSEYGHWDYIEEIDNENYFHAGDVIYLDLTEFSAWKNDDALMYVNFTYATKEMNGGNDVDLANPDYSLYNPKLTYEEIDDNIYAYTVTYDDEHTTELRFWRGNYNTLWNCSIILSYDDFSEGKNCVKVTDWDDNGYTYNYNINDVEKYLYSDKDEILVEDDDGIVYFYVEDAESSDADITLYEDGISIGTFYDDGNYSIHGDDIRGDGVYSLKYSVDINAHADDTHTYYAIFQDGTKTNEIQIKIIVPFTEEELSDMRYVDDKISAVLMENKTPDSLIEVPWEYIQNGTQAESYKEIFDKRCSELNNVLNSLLDEGMLGSYYYDDINRVYNCEYSNGIVFLIIPDDILENSTYNVGDYDFSITESDACYDGYSAVILNLFEDTSYRTEYYEKLTDVWESKGMDVDYDDFVTVEDLKTKLANKDLIALCGHGSVVGTHPVLHIMDENSKEETVGAYYNDIKENRIISSWNSGGESLCVITSTFFSYYYKDNGLQGSFIFSESCNFMGNNDIGINYEFTNAFLGCSAQVVVGFHNSVVADYSRELMVTYFEKLLNGQSASNAFNEAGEECGYSDYEYRKVSFIDFLFDRDIFEKMGDVAFPLINGNGYAVLKKELKNGDFENVLQKKFANPLFWQNEGDVRTIEKMGEIESNGTRMAFLSTGIGSKSGVALSGTQGSTMSQMVHNTNKSIIEFKYNVISEEPMEFVGSKYDDKFEVQILDYSDRVLYSEVIESVNSSTWYQVTGVDFDGGDDTVYQTNWKTKTIDISSYQSQFIKIKFLVYDVGDSAYDTAVVIDDISWR